MRWLILSLAFLWLESPVEAQDLEEIARVMAEREDATYPFAVSYWVQVEPGGLEAEVDLLEARTAQRVDRMLWRGAAQPSDPWAFEDEEPVVREEHCWARDGTTWWFVKRDPETWWMPWHGEIAAPVKFTWRVLPSDFGLEFASQRLSTFLHRPSARIRGRGNVARFECVVVLLDWMHPKPSRIQHPLGLWLAVEHDYYPVQIVRYTREADPHVRNENLATIDGKVYKPGTWRVVDELTVVGRARFPVRARQLSLWRFDDALRMNVDRATLRLGSDVTEDDFDLPSWMYVVDRRSGVPYFVTPLGPIPLSGIAIAIYVIFALAIALEARRRWKKRRRRKAEPTVWDEVREGT
jgi:hypothetical protein